MHCSININQKGNIEAGMKNKKATSLPLCGLIDD